MNLLERVRASRWWTRGSRNMGRMLNELTTRLPGHRDA